MVCFSKWKAWFWQKSSENYARYFARDDVRDQMSWELVFSLIPCSELTAQFLITFYFLSLPLICRNTAAKTVVVSILPQKSGPSSKSPSPWNLPSWKQLLQQGKFIESHKSIKSFQLMWCHRNMKPPHLAAFKICLRQNLTSTPLCFRRDRSTL